MEQFVICSPEGDASWQMMDEMLGNAEEFYQVRGGQPDAGGRVKEWAGWVGLMMMYFSVVRLGQQGRERAGRSTVCLM